MIRFISASALGLVAALLSLNADARDLSGVWVGNVTCRGQYIEPQPWPLTVTVAGNAVAASTPNAAGAGVVSGSTVTFTLTMLMNAAHFTGTVSGNTMRGTYVQGGSGPCSWFASRAGGTPAVQQTAVPGRHARCGRGRAEGPSGQGCMSELAPNKAGRQVNMGSFCYDDTPETYHAAKQLFREVDHQIRKIQKFKKKEPGCTPNSGRPGFAPYPEGGCGVDVNGIRG